MEAGRNSRIKTHHELLHSRDFLCCCCFHVRTGTIAFGMIHVMMQMATITVIATAILNPEALSPPKNMQSNGGYNLENRVDVNRDTFGQITSMMKSSKQANLVSALLLNTLVGFISMMLVHGAFWGHPTYLLPFFAILCCNFAAAMLRLIGSFAEPHTSPHSREAPLHGFYLMMSVILKAYLLNMIWSCYKFLRLRQDLLRHPPVALPSQPAIVTCPAAMEASQLLPDYEATQKYPYNFYAAPPPSYSMATQMPTVGQVVAPPPSYDDVAGTSQQVDLPPESVVVVAGASGINSSTPDYSADIQTNFRVDSSAGAPSCSSAPSPTSPPPSSLPYDGSDTSQEARTAADRQQAAIRKNDEPKNN